MSQGTTRKEACEAYDDRWQKKYFDEETWKEILNLLYDGHGPTEIIRTLDLDPQCKSSLTVHAREHRGFIAFMRGVRMKDKRLQLGATLGEAWRELIDRIFHIALDPSTKPGVAVKAATVAQKEMVDLQKLAQAAVTEFEKTDDGGEVTNLEEQVRKIARDVYGIQVGGDGDG